MWVHIGFLSIVFFIVIGVIAGWLTGLVFQGRGFGLVGNLIVGGVGAVIGGVIFNYLDIQFYGLIGSLMSAFAGAVLFVLIILIIRRA